VKSKGARLAFIENATIGPDEIHAVRPSGVGGLHLVVEAIDDSGKLDAQSAHTGTRYRGALFLVAGAAVIVVSLVGWIGEMRREQ